MRATYRLQLTPEFGFDAARSVLPYLERLGVSHLYLSPITEAREGSTHGYDVTAHDRIREAFGGRDAFEALREAAVARGMGLVLDFVPNHAGVGTHNAYWQDVLAYGPHARYASYFDIDWEPSKPALQEKVLLPFLGRPYGDVLDDGELSLTYEDGRFFAAYYDNRFALSPATYDAILEGVLPAYERTERYFDIKELAAAYGALAPEDRATAEGLRPRLTAVGDATELATRAARAIAGGSLHALLERQFWRLAYWKTAGAEINYRRFFDINELVGLRMENPDVFWATHRLMAELVVQDGVEGLRIDHVDGLAAPREYLERLRRMGARKVWVEKILAPGEILPDAWPTAGTTGYEFLNDVMGVLVDPRGEAPLLRSYRRLTGRTAPFEEEVYRSKLLVMRTSLSGELFRLARELDRLSEADYHTRDFTLQALREALEEIIAAFPRYRTYLPNDRESAHEVVRDTVARAKRRNPASEPSVYDFVARVLVGALPETLRDRQEAFVRHFQQYTAPVAAKGVEDTAFYRYVPLVALNEVGGEPEPFAALPPAFHARARFRAYRYPHNLLATATHDHKRGEDTRMRIVVLAEMPDRWEETLAGLSAEAEAYRAARPDALVRERSPSANDEYLFHQILVALWDPDRRDGLAERLVAYLRKAAREAKLHTSWSNPDEEYEAGMEAFVRHMVANDRVAEAVAPLAAELARHGFTNGMSQTILKLVTPGVPDLYQGSELLDLSLVDPDNRGAVDYERRERVLDELETLLSEPDGDRAAAMYRGRDERFKAYLVAALLRFRRDRPAAFDGTYSALQAEGARAEQVLAFVREADEDALVVAVPRFPARLEREGGWSDTRLPLPAPSSGRGWRDLLTGRTFDGEAHVALASLALPFLILHADR